MRKFNKENEELASTMKSHLINDLDSFGIWDDNYELFFNQRAKALSREMKKRIIEADIDKTMTAELEDDQGEENELTQQAV
jgi:hypothetical protein